MISSNAVRKTARANALTIQQGLSAGEAQQHNRAALKQLLSKQRWLSEYYRYKVGLLDTDLGIPLFTVLAHADSWDLCFEKVKKLARPNQSLNPRGEDADPEDPDSAEPDPNASVPDSE